MPPNSPALDGWIAEALGYVGTFLLLGSFVLIAIALWNRLAGRFAPTPSTFQRELVAQDHGWPDELKALRT